MSYRIELGPVRRSEAPEIGPDSCQEATIGALLRRQAEVRPLSVALIAPDRAPMTYGELWRQTRVIGAMLRARRVSQGQRVGLVMPNGAEAASAFIGIATHATCVPLNPNFRRSEFVRDLTNTRVSLLVTGADVSSELSAAAQQLDMPILSIAPIPQGPAGSLDFSGLGDLQVSIEELADDALPNHVALLIQTSGTSGQQKIVPLTHANLAASSVNLAFHLALKPTDRCLNVMPLFHSHALRGALLTTLYAGASVICTPGFQADKIIAWMNGLGPTWYTAVPTVHQSVLAAFRDLKSDAVPPRLRFIRSTSSALPPATLLQLESLLQAPVIESYGMTECSVICINPLPPGDRRIGSVGKATNIDLKIADESGNECVSETVGQIMVRGVRVFEGYENNDAANAQAFIDGWFKTGDLARQDADGYVYVTGRVGEIVNRGGVKIAPREVDDALLEHPAVAQAVAFGVPHATLGQDLMAAIVVRPSYTVDESALRAHLMRRLVDSKVPTSMIFLDEIPKGSIGKVQRTQLHVMLADQLRKAFVEPSSRIEESLVAVICDVLNQQHVGVHDNFFSLGGDSLSAMRVVHEMERRFGVRIPVRSLVHESVAAIAAATETVVPAPAAAASKPSGWLKRVASLHPPVMEVEARRFGSPQRRMLGLLQHPQPRGSRRAAFLLFRPFGQEAVRTAPIYREMSDRLAREGCTVLTFDPHGCGDSPGELNDQSLADWAEDSLAADGQLRQDAPGVPMHWFGLGLGASIAASAALRADPAPDRLALWEPVMNGPAYLRRMLSTHRAESGEARHRWFGLAPRREVSDPVLPGIVLGFMVGKRLHQELLNLEHLPLSTLAGRSTRLWVALQEEERRSLADSEVEGLTLQPVETHVNWMSIDARGTAIVPQDVMRTLLATLSSLND